MSKIVVLAIVLPVAVRAWQRINEVTSERPANSAVQTLDSLDAPRPDSSDQ